MKNQLIILQMTAIAFLHVVTSNQHRLEGNITAPFESALHVKLQNNHNCKGAGNLRHRRSYLSTEEPLHCPPCEQIHCYKHRNKRLNCKGGWTLGVCGCCRVCAKLHGEPCGGQYNYLGKCDEGLICDPQEPSIISFVRNGVKKIYRVEKGICKKVSPRRTPEPEVCRPKCNPDYCFKNPRGICSAIENADKLQKCQGICQHTSCRACKFIQPDQQCLGCAKNDFKCIKDFGRCTRKQACKAKSYPCGNQIVKKNIKEFFLCQVPACL